MQTMAHAFKKVPKDTTLGKMVAKAIRKNDRCKRKAPRPGYSPTDDDLVRIRENKILRALLGRDETITACSSLKFKPGRLVRFRGELARIKGCLRIAGETNVVLSYEEAKKLENSDAKYRLGLVHLDKEEGHIEIVK
jgi:hypothetical protein